MGFEHPARAENRHQAKAHPQHRDGHKRRPAKAFHTPEPQWSSPSPEEQRGHSRAWHDRGGTDRATPHKARTSQARTAPEGGARTPTPAAHGGVAWPRLPEDLNYDDLRAREAIGVPFFSVVYFSRGTLPQRGKRALLENLVTVS